MPLLSARNDTPDFLKSVLPNEFFEFRHALRSRHQNDFPHRIRVLERLNRMGQDRLVTEQGEEFVGAHSLAAPARDDDGA